MSSKQGRLRAWLHRLFPVKIEAQIRWAIALISISLSLLTLVQIVTQIRLNVTYDNAVSCIVRANEHVYLLRDSFRQESYFIAAERKPLEENQLPELLKRWHSCLTELEKDTPKTLDSYENLQVLTRTSHTLEKYLSSLQELVKRSGPYRERMKLVEDITSVTDTMTDQLNLYIYSELVQLQTLNQKMLTRTSIQIGLFIFVLLLISLGTFALMRKLQRTIVKPIYTLTRSAHAVAEGDLTVQVPTTETNELGVLEHSFNHMTEQIRSLIDKEKEDATRLRETELKLLQEQINPHFLYNTLETIIWQIEKGEPDEAIHTVELLSRFFRKGLSGGRSIISLGEEIQHIESYLSIQQVRYRDILNYEVSIPEELRSLSIPKMTLQPIVENALYHGLKAKRGPGRIYLSAQRMGEFWVLSVLDDGAGMSEEQAQRLQAGLDQPEQSEIREDGGLGLRNISNRLKLYFGEEAKITVLSRLGQGTIIQIRIPAEPVSKEPSV